MLSEPEGPVFCKDMTSHCATSGVSLPRALARSSQHGCHPSRLCNIICNGWKGPVLGFVSLRCSISSLLSQDALSSSPDLQPHFSSLGTSVYVASVLLPSGTMCLILLRASARRRH